MKKIHEALTEILPRIIELSEDIYCHPELGFKEFRSREKVTEALSQAGIPYKDVAYTGLTATLDSGRPSGSSRSLTRFLPWAILMPIRTITRPTPAATMPRPA